MLTYTVIIYQNYIVLKLGKYVRKISSKSVHKCKFYGAKSISRKSAQTNFWPKLVKISTKEGQIVTLVFWGESGKKISTPKNQLFSTN